MEQPEEFVSLTPLRGKNLSCMWSARGHLLQTGWQSPSSVLSSGWQAIGEFSLAPRAELELVQSCAELCRVSASCKAMDISRDTEGFPFSRNSLKQTLELPSLEDFHFMLCCFSTINLALIFLSSHWNVIKQKNRAIIFCYYLLLLSSFSSLSCYWNKNSLAGKRLSGWNCLYVQG